MDKFRFICVTCIIFHYQIVIAEIVNDEQKENSAVDEKCTSVCSSNECTEVAKTLIDNMDQSVDPCDDFYQFVCGNYIKNNKIPEDEVFVSQSDIEHNKLFDKLKDGLNTEALPTDSEAVKKMKLYYQNCMNIAEIESIGTAPLLDLIKRVGGWPVLLGDQWKDQDYKWEDLISSISKEGFSIAFPFTLFTSVDSTDSRKFSIEIVPAFTKYHGKDEKLVGAFQSYLVEIAVLLGANREKANTEMKDLVEFDKKLFEACSPPNPLSATVSRVKNQKTISDLSKEYPDLPWLDIINIILSPHNVAETELVEVNDRKFMSEIGTLLKSTPKRVLANYIVYLLIDGLMPYLPEKLRNQKFTFYQKAYGAKKLPDRKDFCFIILNEYFHVALSSFYIKNYFDKESKNKVNEMSQYIREESKASLEKLDWMDDDTRHKALKKLEAMKIIAAYPDEILDDKKVDNFYGNLEITAGKFFDNVQKVKSVHKNSRIKLLTKPLQEIAWIYEAWVVFPVVYCEPKENKLSIAAGALVEPLFKAQWPDYLNYGGIGYTIGHQITHGFDNIGRKFDHDGNSKEWWSNKTSDEFEHKVQCIIDEYDNYNIKQINQKINGTLTKDKNVADENGIKLAYRAYEKLIKSKGATEECLPDIKYTPKQMFWISAATSLCTKETDTYLKAIIKRGFRTPEEARINVVFADNEEFAKDFNCPADSKMNPTKKCQVW